MSTISGIAHVWDTAVGQIDNTIAKRRIGQILLREMREIMCPKISPPVKNDCFQNANTTLLIDVLRKSYTINKLMSYRPNNKIDAIRWLRTYMKTDWAFDLHLKLAKEWVEFIWNGTQSPFIPKIDLVEQIPF